MFIRYPGSKSKLYRHIRGSLPMELTHPLWAGAITCYCEPFFGSGAIGWKLLRYLHVSIRRIVVNDIDPGIYALWLAVRDTPKDLIELVRDFEPSPESFEEFKRTDGDKTIDPLVLGFRKLALHQTSYSGLGAMSGGPLGGKNQRSEYNVSCRWNAERIKDKVVRCHILMRKRQPFDILCADFQEVLGRLPASAFAYLDPPYYRQGQFLYKYAFSELDHERLAQTLRKSRFKWLLSYDDSERIRSLYSWARISGFEMTPTVQRAKGVRRKNQEIMVCNFA